MNSDSIELRSARIVPRPTVEDDLDWVLAAEQVPQNAVGITPWSRNDHRDVVRSPDGSHWVLEASGDRRILGYLIFRGLTSPERSIELKRIVISEKRRGYGREGLQLAKQLAFERFRAHRLWLDVFTDNEGAWQLYESDGFTREGILRECWLDGERYRSLVILSLLEREYRSQLADRPIDVVNCQDEPASRRTRPI